MMYERGGGLDWELNGGEKGERVGWGWMDRGGGRGGRGGCELGIGNDQDVRCLREMIGYG